MSHAQKTPLSRGLTLYVNWMIRKFLDRLAKGRPASVVSVSGSIVTVKFEMMGVTLPQVTMPLAGPEYIRYPTQVGDKGFCVPCDYYLGAMSGLGSGTADTTPRGNLSTLVFLPIGNKGWTATDDANAVVVYGPDGVILRDTGKNCKVTVGTANIDVSGKTNVTVEAGSKVQVTVGSQTVTLDGTNVTLVNGSTEVQLAAAQITFTAGGVTMTLSAAGLNVGGLVTATGLTMAGGGGNANLGTGTLTAADATLDGRLFSTHKHSGVTTGGAQTGPIV